MVKQMNMHEAKTNFSKLAQQVEAGEEVLIARDEKVIMRLWKFEAELPVPRDFSSLKGLAFPIIDEEWDLMDQEFLDSIEYGKLDA
jgi:hypothetical protein